MELITWNKLRTLATTISLVSRGSSWDQVNSCTCRVAGLKSTWRNQWPYTSMFWSTTSRMNEKQFDWFKWKATDDPEAEGHGREELDSKVVKRFPPSAIFCQQEQLIGHWPAVSFRTKKSYRGRPRTGLAKCRSVASRGRPWCRPSCRKWWTAGAGSAPFQSWWLPLDASSINNSTQFLWHQMASLGPIIGLFSRNFHWYVWQPSA